MDAPSNLALLAAPWLERLSPGDDCFLEFRRRHPIRGLPLACLICRHLGLRSGRLRSLAEPLDFGDHCVQAADLQGRALQLVLELRDCGARLLINSRDCRTKLVVDLGRFLALSIPPPVQVELHVATLGLRLFNQELAILICLVNEVTLVVQDVEQIVALCPRHRLKLMHPVQHPCGTIRCQVQHLLLQVVQPIRDVLELFPEERVLGLAASAHDCPWEPMGELETKLLSQTATEPNGYWAHRAIYIINVCI